MSSDDQQYSGNKLPSGYDRRAFPRFACDVVQKIARLVNAEVPACDAFEKVPCADISRGGFSFFRATVPQWNALVVALGEPPHRVFFTAEIVNSEKVDYYGHAAYRVGCRFTGRVDLNEDDIFEQVDDLESAFMLFAGRGK